MLHKLLAFKWEYSQFSVNYFIIHLSQWSPISN